jgi:surface antigen
MEGFKKLPKQIACFKEGGSVQKEVHNFTKRDRKNVEPGDLAQDKKLIKKAFKQHDRAEHDKEPTEIKLKKGGRAKKETGTVKKFCGGGNAYKEGGSVTNVYEAKKKSGDISNIEKVKDIKPGKAAAPSKAAVKPNFFGSDVEKEKSKPSGHKDPYIKSKQSGKAAAAPSGAKGPDAYKKGGKVKKMADGQLTAPMSGTQQAAMQGALPGGQGLGSANDMERRRMMERAKRAMQNLGPAQQSEFVNQGGMSPTGVTPTPTPTPLPASAPMGVGAPAGSTVPGGMKKGGKAKKDCK